MAKKKTKKTTTRRRSGGRSSNMMSSLMDTAMLAGGIIVGNMLGSKLPIQNPTMRNGALLVGGVFLKKYIPANLANVATGVSVGGALNLAGQFLPQLTAGTVQGIGRQISPSTVEALRRAVREGVSGPTIVGAREPAIVGGEDAGEVMYL